MNRLLLVSNRLPVSIEKRKGEYQFRQSVGGLATGLRSVCHSYKTTWVGWCGFPRDKLDAKTIREIELRLMTEVDSFPMFLYKKDIKRYYHGFSNRTIWPLFHYFTDYVVYDNELWESYVKINNEFCDTVVKIADEDDVIWVHDYHLMLLPRLLRERLPDIPIGFFLHIPFPSFEIFRLLPWRKELLKGLLGADLIGFHTYDYVRHFLSSVRRLLGYEHTFGQVSAGNRIVKVDAFPMGIDYERFANAMEEPETRREVSRLLKKKGNRKIILSVDRLDYTKGILQRLESFDLFLDKYPEYKEKVTLIMIAVPSRTGVDTYFQLKKKVDELVGRINGKHGIIGWIPVWYLYRSLPIQILTAFYYIADVALVTPLRDGMNLISKEFIATKSDTPGVLILSEMAGASAELGEALIVNPNNKEAVADKIKEALELSPEEQMARNREMQKRLRRYNVVQWSQDFMERLSAFKKLQAKLLERKLSLEVKKRIINDYQKSTSRLLLLDYDGTLITFAERPEKAQPDYELLKQIDALARNPHNEVVLISGRDKETLDRWFGSLNVGLIAEHGVWYKERGAEWTTLEPMRSDWKDEIRPILQLYVDRTPGSFLEEKDFSLVWHYRRTLPDLAEVRVRELKDALINLTENLNLGVLEGNKVIEIKSPGITKGVASLRWISKKEWDFILAVGDDLTDEDMFRALPEGAYSIKVGLSPSQAKYTAESVGEVRLLLKELEREDYALSGGL
ncbi:bifunctional alpha,alpha-trehalose-phosphate synthase (UDP-forming)/trehalose-phosphatase [Candidatus Sumerlaeota bacterium]|nr:bifunctional alpha,alpha-trehalose-phosphate synthase (UDP-forming)/trehalose-phosphatase [Candidatus Sumerlaeota bacterium]